MCVMYPVKWVLHVKQCGVSLVFQMSWLLTPQKVDVSTIVSHKDLGIEMLKVSILYVSRKDEGNGFTGRMQQSKELYSVRLTDAEQLFGFMLKRDNVLSLLGTGLEVTAVILSVNYVGLQMFVENPQRDDNLFNQGIQNLGQVYAELFVGNQLLNEILPFEGAWLEKGSQHVQMLKISRNYISLNRSIALVSNDLLFNQMWGLFNCGFTKFKHLRTSTLNGEVIGLIIAFWRDTLGFLISGCFGLMISARRQCLFIETHFKGIYRFMKRISCQHGRVMFDDIGSLQGTADNVVVVISLQQVWYHIDKAEKLHFSMEIKTRYRMVVIADTECEELNGIMTVQVLDFLIDAECSLETIETLT